MSRKHRPFKMGRTADLGGVCRQLSRVLSAMADGRIDATLGSRLANGLGILRAALSDGAIAQEIAVLNAKVELLAQMANANMGMKDITPYEYERQTITPALN